MPTCGSSAPARLAPKLRCANTLRLFSLEMSAQLREILGLSRNSLVAQLVARLWRRLMKRLPAAPEHRLTQPLKLAVSMVLSRDMATAFERLAGNLSAQQTEESFRKIVSRSSADSRMESNARRFPLSFPISRKTTIWLPLAAKFVSAAMPARGVDPGSFEG